MEKRITRWTAFAVFLLMMISAAAVRDGKLLGHDLAPAQSAAAPQQNDTVAVAADGSVTVSTAPLAKDVNGFGGPVPVRIHIDKDGKVTRIEALPNAETPDFFSRASALFRQWEGKTVADAAALHVDAVSGATFSSKAIITNVQRGLAYASAQTSEAEPDMDVSASAVAALVVALLGAVVPLFLHNRRWHTVQLLLNVGVLGLWTGTFVSYSLLLNVFANGISLSALATMAAPAVMLVTAFVYPLFGRGGHYCAHICPFGSAQELAGRLRRRKPVMSPRLIRSLTTLRNVLWGVLMVLMLTGIWSAWMDYELFTAFLVGSASVGVLVAAVAVLVISVIVPRPYCRFVCPTGALMKLD